MFKALLSGARAIAAVAGLSLAGTASAGGTFDISLTDKTARVAIDAAKIGSGLHLAGAFQHHIDRGNLASIAAHVVDQRERNSPLYLGVGTNLYSYFGEDTRGTAFAVGGFFRYDIEALKDVSIAGHAYYAPPVISFADIENMTEFDLSLQYRLIPTARVYIGFRKTSIDSKTENGAIELDDGAHFGLKLDF